MNNDHPLTETQLSALAIENHLLQHKITSLQADHEKALRDLKEKTALHEKQKDEFLSIASHQLKTPLTSIKAYNQLMQKVTNPEQIASFIQRSGDQINRLEKLISDLLDVTKIADGKLMYNFVEFDFMEMAHEAVGSLQGRCPDHRIVLDHGMPILIKGDRQRLEQVLNNFLLNAVKYSNGGDIVVKLCVALNNVIVSVQDFGIGIPAKDMGRLFDRYYRSDNSVRRFEGLGLGLYISSEILKRHNGSFWAESEEGEGSTFFFRLPLTDVIEEGLHNSNAVYEDPQISIYYNLADDRIEVDWHGYQDFNSVQRGCLAMLSVLQQYPCSQVLNDNSNVLGTWSEASDWVGREWFPQMEEAGLCHFAWVYSPSTFSQLSAKKSVAMVKGNLHTQLFTSKRDAEKWLKMMI